MTHRIMKSTQNREIDSKPTSGGVAMNYPCLQISAASAKRNTANEGSDQ
jgi:hypothetical protein